jgi:hypothetical protein
MDTAEMRLLTVPQFARRVSRSEDEVLALIQARDVKALRPDPEGGYRVLETEVDRLLQTHTTRIKRKQVSRREGVQEQSVPLEAHLSAVTALENERDRNARLERLNSTLQKELFVYLKLMDENTKELLELRTRQRATHERLLEMEKERMAYRQRRQMPWWKRLFA